MTIRTYAPHALCTFTIAACIACRGPDMSGMDPSLGSGVSGIVDGTTSEGGELEEESGGKLDLPPASDLPLPGDDECVSESAEAQLTAKPVDVIVFVDTSSSMRDVSDAVQDNLNLLLTSLTAIEDTDVRVILIAGYGANEFMCVPAPLGNDDCNPPGPKAPVGPTLFQYSLGLGSSTFLDLMRKTYTGEQLPNAAVYDAVPMGWQSWARPEALKVILAVTDAESMSTSAAAGDTFDAELLALAPEQFGTPDARNYVLHSITGIYHTDPPVPYPPTDPLIVSECMGEPGQPLQQVAMLTGGLRFGLCDSAHYGDLFGAIATGAAELTPVACDFAIPDAPPGETLDPDTLQVEYFPGALDPAEVLHQVPSEAECEPSAFWVDATSIHLCHDACATVQSDEMARVDVTYGCDVGYDPNG